MPEPDQESATQKMLGGFGPEAGLAHRRRALRRRLGTRRTGPRDRSLITVAALIAGGNSERLPFHLNLAKQNGLTETELKEPITPGVLLRLAQGDVHHRCR
jgi:4-carboxymuconolactone decarboxylase